MALSGVRPLASCLATGRHSLALATPLSVSTVRLFSNASARTVSECEKALPSEHTLVSGSERRLQPRVGVLAKKIGMVSLWNAYGAKEPLTVLRLEDNEVVGVKKRLSGRGVPRVNLQVGAGEGNPKRLSKALLTHYKKSGVQPKRKMRDFPVALDCVLPVGTKITADHFRAGQMIDVQGKSRGKGFEGVMKRWGFAGQNATHGNSKTHRQMGSTGNCQDPGKVWKGKKMPGRMGYNLMTQLNCQIYKIDLEKDLLFVRGSVPGPTGQFLRLRDAQFPKRIGKQATRPFPMNIPQEGDEHYDEIIMDISSEEDPFQHG